MNIYEVLNVNNEIVEAFKRLIPQLAPNAPLPNQEYLQEMISGGSTHLFIAEDKEIIGSLTLVFNTIPTGKKAWIEDVVVDNNVRGKGTGEALVRHAIQYCYDRGINKIDLTSSPERVAANKLYQKIGFTQRTTNVYRLELKVTKVN